MNLATRMGAVIVGGSLAGLTAAEALRDEGYTGPISLIGEEAHLPYRRPALSKQVLSGTWTPAEAAIRDASHLAGLDVEWLLGQRADRLEVSERTIHVGPRAIAYEHLIIATGAAARRLPSVPLRDGVFALRTLDDAVRLREALAGARRVAIVGGGVLACEVASAVRGAGSEAVVIGRSNTLSFGALGASIGDRMASLLTAHGVELRLGVDAVGVAGESAVSGVRLADGSIETADVVIVAAGCVPAVGWLHGSGLDLTDGIRCDEYGRAAPGVYAIGDVASWADTVTGEHRRLEHQQNAIEQAQAVVLLLVQGEASAPIVPFFWSEVFGSKILACGRVRAGASFITLDGDVDGDRFVLASVHDGAIEGLVGWNMPREFRRARAELASHSRVAQLVSPGRDQHTS